MVMATLVHPTMVTTNPLMRSLSIRGLFQLDPSHSQWMSLPICHKAQTAHLYLGIHAIYITSCIKDERGFVKQTPYKVEG